MSVRFKPAWCATDLSDYRPCDSTYEWYPYDTLPSLEDKRFNGSFQWFGDLGDTVPEETAVLEDLSRALSQVGVSLPQDFITFHTRSRLSSVLDEVSVTGCWSDLSEPIPSPVEPGAYLVRFFRDQQDCVLWYLYLRPSGETFIVSSYYLHYYLGDEEPDGDEDKLDPEQLAAELMNEIFWCAPSCEEFAYRFWIENRLWRSLHEKPHQPDAELHRYLDHYCLR